ncbi:uncharacterized protein RSE6_11980 [Rhynchosporium secalis]|uniref:Uncharacterized protein n=1 Tax=Rhynchosporium secalis TaxID=38038 RepID=A0A1E1MP88_RHYSE|nr:uncharacterized protein RSE6_11980 [Rhynchosporium secalis]
MLFSISVILKPWHRALRLTRQSPASWHVTRLAEEKEEVRAAITFIEKLSEESDVFFTISRAAFDGYSIATQPHFTASKRNMLIYAYMVGKFSSRCAFYQTAAILCRAERWKQVREVINPGKNAKLRVVAERYNICTDKFEKVCRRLRRVWPLLP